MRNQQSYIKKYGHATGTELLRLLQQKSNKAMQIAKFKKKHNIP